MNSMRLPLAIGTLLLLSVASVIAADQHKDFSIAPQSLATALDLLIKQADIELLYDSNIVAGKTTDGVIGNMTVPEAVARVLLNTGLDFVFTTSTSVAIKPPRDTQAEPTTVRPLSKQARPSELPVLVVSATRSEMFVSDAPAAASVVTFADLQQRNLSTVDQALNLTPGGYFRRGKGLMDTAANISLRGLPTTRRTAVLLNGIPLNDSYTGSINFTSVNLEDVERIEVVRGPFSSLYGSNAMGGVINIISKQPEGTGARVRLGYGDGFSANEAQENLREIAVSANLQVTESLGLRASFSHRATDGYPTDFVTRITEPPASLSGAIATTDTLGNPRYVIGHRGDNGYQDDNLALAGRYRLSGTSDLAVQYIRSRSEYDYRDPRSLLRNAAGDEQFITAGGDIPQDTPTSNYLAGPGGTDEDLYIGSYTSRIGEFNSQLTLGYIHQLDGWFVTPDVTASITDGPGTGSSTETSHRIADWQLETLIGHRHIITAGFYYRLGDAGNTEHSLVNWRDRSSETALSYEAEGQDLTYALFLQYRFEINDKLTSYLGIRQDWWETRRGMANSVGVDGYPIHYASRSDRHTSPKMALVYRHSPTTRYRFAAGNSFRAPAIFELYRTWLSPLSGTTFQSNPDLNPETVSSWEVGLDHQLDDDMRLAATWFDNRMRDFIYRTVVSTSPPIQRFENAAKAHSRGVELSLSGVFYQVNWQASYTYTDALIDSNPLIPDSEGMQIIQIPKNVATLSIDWRRGRLGLNGSARYVDERFNRDDNSDRVKGVFGAYDSYFLADLSAGYQLTDQLSASFSIDNLTDEQWYDFYLSPGRSWFMRLTLDL